MLKITLSTIHNDLLRIEKLLTPSVLPPADKWWIVKEVNKKTSELLEECRSLFPVWSYRDDAQLDKDFPIPSVLTTREYKPNVEADEEYRNISANELIEKYPDRQFITLRERIIMELQFFKVTGQHLDIDNITLCSGSRSSDGSVPGASWRGGEFRVGCFSPGDADGSLRAREVLSQK